MKSFRKSRSKSPKSLKKGKALKGGALPMFLIPPQLQARIDIWSADNAALNKDCETEKMDKRINVIRETSHLSAALKRQAQEKIRDLHLLERERELFVRAQKINTDIVALVNFFCDQINCSTRLRADIRQVLAFNFRWIDAQNKKDPSTIKVDLTEIEFDDGSISFSETSNLLYSQVISGLPAVAQLIRLYGEDQDAVLAPYYAAFHRAWPLQAPVVT